MPDPGLPEFRLPTPELDPRSPRMTFVCCSTGRSSLSASSQHPSAPQGLQCSGLLTRRPVPSSCPGKVSTQRWHAKDAQADHTGGAASGHNEPALMHGSQLQSDLILAMQGRAAFPWLGGISAVDPEPCCPSPVLQGKSWRLCKCTCATLQNIGSWVNSHPLSKCGKEARLALHHQPHTSAIRP